MGEELEKMLLRLVEVEVFSIWRLYYQGGQELIEDVINRNEVSWVKWRGAFEVLCNHRIEYLLG